MLLRDEFCFFYSVMYGNLTLLAEFCKVNVILRLFQKLLAFQQSRERGIVTVYKLTGAENIAAVYLREMWPLGWSFRNQANEGRSWGRL